MKKIHISDVISLEEYSKKRPDFRKHIISMKEPRRVLVGPYLSFLFENKDTMIYQVQEMIHAEKIIKKSAIQHEIDTYNEMVPDAYELKATLLLEIDNPDVRKVKLSELIGLEKEIKLHINRKHEVFAKYDPAQIDPNKLSSVQFLTFTIGEKYTKALLETETLEIVTNHPACSYRALLTDHQINALKEDLKNR